MRPFFSLSTGAAFFLDMGPSSRQSVTVNIADLIMPSGSGRERKTDRKSQGESQERPCREEIVPSTQCETMSISTDLSATAVSPILPACIFAPPGMGPRTVFGLSPSGEFIHVMDADRGLGDLIC